MRISPETGSIVVWSKQTILVGEEVRVGEVELTEVRSDSPPLYCLYHTPTQYT